MAVGSKNTSTEITTMAEKQVEHSSLVRCVLRHNMDSVETRLYNAKLATAIDDASRVLPSDCEIVVQLGQGSAVVSLLVDGEEIEFVSNLETLAQTIADALSAAQDLNG